MADDGCNSFTIKCVADSKIELEIEMAKVQNKAAVRGVSAECKIESLPRTRKA